ncbi:MAG: 30S ribosomal protein S17 [Actinomycetota bacterium]
MTATDEATRGERKVRQGIVVSDKMDKTVVVEIERRTTHPLYHKIVTLSERLHAHDETNEVGVGDRVRVAETRPLSKHKRWRVVEVVERAK